MNNTNSEMKLDETKSNVAQSENIIELKNITKQYDDLLVLDNLNLDIKKNEFLTLLGPSGCGKTTTLKIIACKIHERSNDYGWKEGGKH